jgi:hypothetical protein
MKPIVCPCCSRPVRAPTLDLVVDHLRVPPMQARIFGAIWKGKGRPVQVEMILAAMDRGVDVKSHDYSDFKIALHHLRERLKPVGISIPNAGYAQGYFIHFVGGGKTDVAVAKTQNTSAGNRRRRARRSRRGTGVAAAAH